TYQLSGTVLLNGINPTSSCTSASRATVRFTDSAQGYAFSYDVPCPVGGGASGAPFAFSGAIFPGTYRVTVAGGLSNLPTQQYVISESFPVTGNVLNQSLNVSTFQASGTVLLNGINPTSSCTSASRATVRFTDSAKGYAFSYDVPCPVGGGASGAPFNFSGAIFPGTYRVTVAGGLSNLPTEQYVISEAFPVASDVLNQTLNVTTFQAGGTVLLNGINPTSSCTSASRATVRFTDSTKGYAFAYDVPCPVGGGASGAPFNFSGAIFPGTYRVTVAGGLSNLPTVQYVISEAFPVTGNVLSQSLNVVTHQASGTVLLNGINPTSSCTSASRATVRFTDSTKGYAFSYDVACPVGGGASGAPFTFSGAIFPGTYRVTVAGGLSNLPTQQYVISEAFPVAGDVLNQSLNVVTHQASGTVLLNGINPTSSCTSASRATVRFTDSTKGYAFSYDVPCPVGGGASGAPFNFSGAIFPGTYRITVAGGLSNLPTVQYVISESFAVTSDVLNQSLNVITFQAAGTVLLNGATPTSSCTSASRATVRFTDSVKGYAFSFDVPCPVGGGASGAPFTFSGLLFPGRYLVTVAGGLSNLPTQQYVAVTTLVVP
ncbi:MAG: hypothetical protein GQE15_35070, partial [Archangiaceae bacterium]|nr:hypothetical protein [Archangiaceae bacterium]